MRHSYLILSVTGVNENGMRYITPYLISKRCKRINGMRHIALTCSVEGIKEKPAFD